MEETPLAHGCGLRQDGPLSLLLFNIVIDPLQQVLDLSTTHGLLHKIWCPGTILTTYLYTTGKTGAAVQPIFAVS
jgi:hypothetical protein